MAEWTQKKKVVAKQFCGGQTVLWSSQAKCVSEGVGKSRTHPLPAHLSGLTLTQLPTPCLGHREVFASF